jgi:hypothetical protein
MSLTNLSKPSLLSSTHFEMVAINLTIYISEVVINGP